MCVCVSCVHECMFSFMVCYALSDSEHTHTHTHTWSRSYNGKVENYRVQRNEKDMVTVDGDDYFDDLIELVEVRRSMVLVLCECELNSLSIS